MKHKTLHYHSDKRHRVFLCKHRNALGCARAASCDLTMDNHVKEYSASHGTSKCLNNQSIKYDVRPTGPLCSTNR